MHVESNPLTGPVCTEEVPLKEAPLVRVIAQVRFSLILSVDRPDFIAPFQEEIGGTYPLLRQESSTQVVFVGSDKLAGSAPRVWRFHDLEGQWRVSLAPDFLALETTAYSSRGEFLERWSHLVEALESHVQPAVVQRLGLRYIDRLLDVEPGELAKLVRPEVLGVLGANLASSIQHSISETVFQVAEQRQLLARWGHLPPGATVDPAAIEPTAQTSWILDIDMFSDREHPFESSAVTKELEDYSMRLYTLFRWIVTDDFLVKFGGAT